MKKRLFFCAFFFWTVFFGHAAGYFAGEGVENFAVMHDFNGGAYIVYVQNGRLKALHEDSNESLTEYTLPENAQALKSIRSLKVYEDIGMPFCVITTDEANSYILTFEQSEESESENFSLYQLPLYYDAENIIFDRLLNGNIRAYYIRDSLLYCLNMNEADYSVISDNCIRTNTGTVCQYGMKRYEETAKGYYVARKSISEYTVSLFSESDNLYTFYDIPESYKERPTVQEICTGENSFYYCITAAGHASIYSADTGAVIKAMEKDGVSEIKKFYVKATSDSKDYFLDYMDKDLVRHVYYGSGGTGYLESCITGVPELLSISESEVWILYGLNYSWKIASLRRSGGLTDCRISDIASESELLCSTFISTPCFLFQNNDNKKLQYDFLSEKGNVEYHTVNIPETIQEAVREITDGSGETVFTGTGEIIVRYAATMLIVNTENTAVEIVPFTLFESSINYNGSLFISYYSRNTIEVKKYGE